MPKTKQKPLRVIPLGGVEEIGKNLTVLEYGQDMIIVDCGLSFPTEEMPGVDVVIPDFTYVEENQERLRGIFITHGHEDHIGALPYLMKKVKAPIYGTRLTLMLIEAKFAENNVKNVKTKCIAPRDVARAGCFSVEFFKTNHSIAESVGLAITTPVGIVVATGDFKVDFTPVDGEVMDFATLSRLGEKGVLLLMADSTNVERPGYTISEKIVGKNLDNFFRGARGRIIISTFSSNIHRIQQIIDSSAAHGRKVCFTGRSMLKIAKMAQDLDILRIKPNWLTTLDKVNSMRDNQVTIITTGSQGEPMSGLVRMAGGDHTHIEIKEGDTVIFSARPIPGNEKFVYRVIDQLFRSGANVIYDSESDVHTSGHACREELKLIHTLVKPKFFVPVHGEYRHLKQHAMLAESLGMNPRDIIIPELGRVIEFTQKSARLGQEVTAGAVMVDGFSVGDVGNVVLRDRMSLSQDGFVVVVLPIDRDKGVIAGQPEVISRGFIYEHDSTEFLQKTREIICNTVSNYRSARRKPDLALIKNDVRRDLRKFIYSKTHRNPMILTIVVEV